MSVVVMLVLGLAGLAWSIFSWRRSSSYIEAELGCGRVAKDGILSVSFASGEDRIIRLLRPPSSSANVMGRRRSGKRTRTAASQSKRPKVVDGFVLPEEGPVNVVFIYNRGRSPVTVSRCRYESESRFLTFEPQPGASLWGDHLPKRLDIGEDAVLVHEYESMKAFVNKVMHDSGQRVGVFTVVLTLGDGSEVKADTRMRIHASMGKDEIAGIKGVIRQEVDPRGVSVRRTGFGWQIMHRE